MCGGDLQEELEDNMHRLQVDNARLEAELRHERDRAEMLQAELSDSDKVVGSLLSPLFLSCWAFITTHMLAASQKVDSILAVYYTIHEQITNMNKQLFFFYRFTRNFLQS